MFFDRDHAEFAEAVDPLVRGDDFSRNFVQRHFAAPGAQRSIDKALRLDTQIMLVDDPVKRVDNMTMAWGLEARVPSSTTNWSNSPPASPPSSRSRPAARACSRRRHAR